jgi:hypothetical protein
MHLRPKSPAIRTGRTERGSYLGAKAASLTIMCLGDEDAFVMLRPLLETMGKNTTLVAANGDRQTTKVAKQIMVALSAPSRPRPSLLPPPRGRTDHALAVDLKDAANLTVSQE